MENKDNNYDSNEIPNSDLLIPGIKKVAKATCKIKINKTQINGFLVSLPINLGKRYLYGLMTVNQILSAKYLKEGNKLNLYFEDSKQYINFTVPKNYFVFTCPFLDVSFVEIPLGTFQNIEYLRVCEEPIEDQKIYLIKYTKYGHLSYEEGNIIHYYGADLSYKISNNNKDSILLGAPIISLSKSSLGDVIGLNKNLFLDSENQTKLTTNMNIVLDSIRVFAYKNITTSLKTLSSQKKLSKSEIYILNKIGLKDTENPNVFISPASMFITPLWFYRTQYSWFWTPKQPTNFTLEEIKKCNWSLIQENRPITAIGGIYHDTEPAQRNIKLIKLLINSGLKFLIS